MPAAKRRDLQARAQGLPIKVRKSASDIPSYIEAADVVVGMAGYNTTAEILRIGTPAVLVPRAAPSAEQRMRARLFEERGWVHVVDPDDLSPATLADAVLDALSSEPAAEGPDLAGLEVAVGEILSLLEADDAGERSPPRPAGGVTLHVDEVLSGRTGALGVRGALRSSPWRRNVRGVLVDAMAGPTPLGPCRLRRTKFKPGRKLTAYFDANVVGHGGPRAIAVTWQAADGAPVGRSAHETALEAEAGRRGLGLPFRSLTAAAPELRMRVDIAPLDAAFPQLVRLSDPAYVTKTHRRLDRSSTSSPFATVRDNAMSSSTVPRPSSRGRRSSPSCTGTSRGRVLSRWPSRSRTSSTDQVSAPAPGRWPTSTTATGHSCSSSVPGRPLSACLRGGARGIGRDLRTGGATLRRLHDAPAELGALVEPRPVEAELRATDRACEAIQHLLPRSGPVVRDILARTRDLLTRVPAEGPRFAHGDYKADHLLVGRSGVTLIDFDRCARADPSLDLAKFLADLRWWTTRRPARWRRRKRSSSTATARRHGRELVRARVLEPLLLLKMTARRVPVHEPDWDGRTSALVLQADRVLRDVERANP